MRPALGVNLFASSVFLLRICLGFNSLALRIA
jgi:hypothetical protein